MWASSRVCKPPELESKGPTKEVAKEVAALSPGSGCIHGAEVLYGFWLSALGLWVRSDWGGANGPMGGDGHRSAIAPSWL
jgi:hypothetical protein